MSFYDRIDTGVLAEFSVAQVLPTNMAGQYDLGNETQSKMDNSMSKHKILSDAFQVLIDQIEDVSGEKYIKQGPDGINSSYQPVDQTFRVGSTPTGLGLTGPLLEIFASVTGPKVNEADAQSIFDRMEELGIDGPRSIKEVREIANENARLQQEEMMAIEQLQPGWKPWIGRMAGRMVAIFEDPVNVYTLPFGATKGMSISKMLFTDFVVNAGAEAVIQPSVKKWYNELGLEYDIGDVMTAIGTAGLFGAGFGVTIRVGGETIRLSAEQVQKGLAAFRKTDLPASTELNQALEAVDNITEMETENPLSDLMEHTNRLNAAMDQIDNNAANMPEKPVNQVVSEREMGPGVAFDPDEIKVDAKTFQFKEETADQFGVVDDLRNVDVWNQEQAGVATVYEYLDGSHFIVDGHQRLGIAKRAKAKGQEGVKIFANVIREADGFTPTMARVNAAIKNIIEETGTAIDAAKVLRDFPERVSELDGVAKNLVRTSRGLSNLSDDAFGMVINDVIDAKMGAVIGRLVQDKELHGSIASILSKTNPANEFEAEAIVRQALEGGTQKTKSLSLFGEEELSESLFLERARILDKTQKAIRKDRAIFNSLVKNADQVESAGNKLVSEVNQRKVATDGEIEEILKKNANRVGPISDALNRAASDAKQSGNFTEATKGFLDSIRRAAEDGNLEGPGASDIRRVVDDPEEISSLSQAANDDLKAFDLVGSEGPKRQGDQLEQDLRGDLEVLDPVWGPADRIEDRLKLSQPIETVEDIYKLAPEAQNFINDIGKRIEKKLDVKFENPGLKEKATAAEKMERKKYKTAQQMTDISRAGFVVKSLYDADEIVSEFSKSADILDTGWSVYPEGYSDRKILVRTPNGIISEIQMWTPNVKAAKFGRGQKIYTKARSSTDAAEKAKLNEEAKLLYNEALKKDIQESDGKLSGIDSGPNILSNIDLNDASLATRLPVWKTSIASTSTQGPLGSTTASALRGSSESNAGRKSQLMNDIDDLDIDTSPTTNVLPGTENVNNLDQEIPIGQTMSEKGVEVADTQTVRDILKDIDQDQRMLDRLEGCAV